MNIIPTQIPDVLIVQPKRFGDHRGYFSETFKLAALSDAGIDLNWVQDNESLSAEVGTIRGLHFQSPPHAQDKLVRCVQGALLDVAVDIRKGSPTYGQHVAVELSAENGLQLLVPAGFAHGFATLLPNTLVQYKVTDVYAPDCDAGIAWDDPELGIDWQTDAEKAVLSDKDRKHPTLADFDSPFAYGIHEDSIDLPPPPPGTTDMFDAMDVPDAATEGSLDAVEDMPEVWDATEEALDAPSYFIVGVTSMLARAWCEHLDANGISWDGASRPDLDITSAQSVEAMIPEGTQFVVNCAAFTNVDKCEEEEGAALMVNGTGVKLLADRCREIGATLIHFSTDYVFSGDATEPYLVDALIAPMSGYGRTKAVGEQLLVKSGCDYRLIRTSWLYAPWANNFVRTMVKLTSDRDTLKVVNDQRGRPTSAEHLAACSMRIASEGENGAYHVADGGECTWYEFAQEIARIAGNTCDIAPCTTAEFPRPAPRPAYSVLDLNKTEALLGPTPHWKDNLTNVMGRLED